MARTLNIPQEAVDAYITHILGDYAKWCKGATPQDFQLEYEIGNNYIKVIDVSRGSRSVHSFIVNKATKGFQVGDILKSATWAAPATNFSRGSVLAPATYVNRVRWTGAM